jgi:hypothetical protein
LGLVACRMGLCRKKGVWAAALGAGFRLKTWNFSAISVSY